MVAKRKPHFFKVLLGDFAYRLKLPPNFLKHIAEEASKEAILQGPNGDSWHVKLGQTTTGTFLSSGWSKFVKDNSLKEKEFLVFRYDGNMHFSIQVFDTTACEREDLFTVKTSWEPKLNRGRKRRDGLEENALNVDCHLKDPEVKLEMVEVSTEDDRAVNQLQNYSSNSMQGSCMTSNSSGVNQNINIDSEDRELPICMVGLNPRQGGYVSRRRPVTAEERSKARQAANSFTSVFPYMILRMTVTNVYRTYMMRFPPCFSKAHLPRRRSNMVLRDPSGKAWVVVYIPSSRDRLSGGWSAFARGNNLEEGDYCVFELVGPVEFCVHIFRVVEETTAVVRVPKKK